MRKPWERWLEKAFWFSMSAGFALAAYFGGKAFDKLDQVYEKTFQHDQALAEIKGDVKLLAVGNAAEAEEKKKHLLDFLDLKNRVSALERRPVCRGG